MYCMSSYSVPLSLSLVQTGSGCVVQTTSHFRATLDQTVLLFRSSMVYYGGLLKLAALPRMTFQCLISASPVTPEAPKPSFRRCMAKHICCFPEAGQIRFKAKLFCSWVFRHAYMSLFLYIGSHTLGEDSNDTNLGCIGKQCGWRWWISNLGHMGSFNPPRSL